MDVMLADSARLQESDCLYVNRKEQRTGQISRTPLYTTEDVQAIMRHFGGVRYGEVVTPGTGMKAVFHDAGHILGSAAISLRVTEAGSTKTILFSGDLGRRQMPILRDPHVPTACDVLIIESTYGDRTHNETAEEAKAKASTLISHAVTHRSKIIVPAFAVGRTQDLVMWIKELVKEGRIAPLPIYIDSPLALRATEIFRRHPECYDDETYRTLTQEGDPFIARYIHYVSSVQESQKLNTMKGPCIIISASGMCEGGRILHHLTRIFLRMSGRSHRCPPTFLLSMERNGRPIRLPRPSGPNTRMWQSLSLNSAKHMRFDSRNHTVKYRGHRHGS